MNLPLPVHPPYGEGKALSVILRSEATKNLAFAFAFAPVYLSNDALRITVILRSEATKNLPCLCVAVILRAVSPPEGSAPCSSHPEHSMKRLELLSF
jgi:hypothetical protein